MARRYKPKAPPDGTVGALYIDAATGAPVMRLKIREADGQVREYDVRRNHDQRRDGEADYWVAPSKDGGTE